MVQILPQSGSIFGRVGKGIGQGLAEQVPKEIERYRLSQGLKQLGQQEGLTPFQQFAELSGIPGITPQMIQSGSELLRQQARNQAFLKNAEMSNRQMEPKKASQFPAMSPENKNIPSKVPSITKEDPLTAIQQGYIPPTQDQIVNEAREAYAGNEPFFNNDPNNAIQFIENKYQKEKERVDANLKFHENLSNIQDNVINRLRQHSSNLGVKIPSNIYSKIEDQAIQATKPKSEGGRGLTEQQAMKEYGAKLDEISRDYQSLEDIGNFSYINSKPSKIKESIRTLQKQFKKRGDQENLADQLIDKAKITPSKAYYLAYPVSDIKELNNAIVKLPNLDQAKIANESDFPSFEEIRNRVVKRSEDISRKIAPLLGQEGSPLAVAEELKSRGYDPEIFIKYLSDHQDELKLSPVQVRQLNKPTNVFPNLNDNWLFLFSGLDQLVEQ